MPLINYVLTIVLIILSGLFSGLNLGLLSLSVSDLKRKAALGNSDAAKVLPVRLRGNQLLVTLLLGNVAVNAALSIFLADISTGLVGGILSTALIVIFGEILPQSFFSRHALKVGAQTVFFTRLYLFLFAPIAYPIGKFLDKTLGEELPDVYTKEELKAIISEHEDNPESPLDEDEENIIIGALTFSNKQVRDVMTPRSVVFALEQRTTLTRTVYEEIKKLDFTRIPVFKEDVDNIIGLLYVKDLLGVNRGTLVKNYVRPDSFIVVELEEKLDQVFNKLLSKRIHMGCVFNEFGEFQGVITVEDIIEEIIQAEVYDEGDTLIDPRTQALKKGKQIFQK